MSAGVGGRGNFPRRPALATHDGHLGQQVTFCRAYFLLPWTPIQKGSGAVKLGILRSHEHAVYTMQRLADVLLVAAIYPFLTWIYGTGWTGSSGSATLVGVLVFTVAAELCGLYRPWRIERFRVEIRTVFLVWLITAGVLMMAGFATKTLQDYSRVVSVGWFLLAPLVLSSWRLAVRSTLRGLRARGWNTRQVAIVGATDGARHLCREIVERPWMGLIIKGVYDDRAVDRREDLADLGCPFRGPLSTLIAQCRSGEVDAVYVTLPLKAEPRIATLMRDLADTTATLYLVPDYFSYQPVGVQMTSIGRV